MKKLFFPLLAATLIAILPACNRSYDSQGNGQLSIKITDAPFPIDMIESAEVTITKVEVRKAGDVDPDASPFLVLFEDTVTLDLADLRNGVVAGLLETEVPAGTYDLIRLYVEEASLKIKDGDTYDVKVPSGQQTGIKIFISPGLQVTSGLTSELLLDFDLSRSFVLRGTFDSPHGINGFIFKPVIRAVNNSTAGRILGKVTDTAMVKIINAHIWAAQDTVVAGTFTDTLGHYALIGLPAGKYSLFAAKENYDTVSYSDITVTQGNLTIKDFMLTHK